MSSSRTTTAKVSFNVGIHISLEECDKYPDPTPILRTLPPHEIWRDELIGPSFDFADVAAGLPNLKTAVDIVCPGRLLEEHRCVKVRVDIQGGLSGGETNLLVKKIIALVTLLEQHLLIQLTARSREYCLVSRESKIAMKPWPLSNVVSSDYDAHVPPMASIKQRSWRNEELERMYRNFHPIWSAHSLRKLDALLWRPGYGRACDFFMLPAPEGKSFRDLTSYIPENPNDPKTAWMLKNKELLCERDPEKRHTYLYFRYLQPTPKRTLLRNWVEVIARIVELALANPDEYKQCLETILTIIYNRDPGERVWEPLMKHVLKLEHRIPEWRDQIS
ncbi:hypothetical protein Neosp_001680 [[Neocosmospora] mangrovei]